MIEEKKLKQIFIIETIIIIVFTVLFIVGIVVVAINKNQIEIGEGEWLGNIIFYGLIILCSVAVLFFLLSFMKHSKDFKAIKNEQFEEVTGKVLRFAKNQDADSGRQINSMPIIQINGSDETIRLKINTFIKIGETYSFIYLKHTKLGEIKIK